MLPGLGGRGRTFQAEDMTPEKAPRRKGHGTCKGQKSQCGGGQEMGQGEAGEAGEDHGTKVRMWSLT